MWLLSPEQVRGARGILKWSFVALAQKSNLGVATVKRFESGKDCESFKIETVQKIRTALESSGKVSFPDQKTIMIHNSILNND